MTKATMMLIEHANLSPEQALVASKSGADISISLQGFEGPELCFIANMILRMVNKNMDQLEQDRAAYIASQALRTNKKGQ